MLKTMTRGSSKYVWFEVFFCFRPECEGSALAAVCLCSTHNKQGPTLENVQGERISFCFHLAVWLMLFSRLALRQGDELSFPYWKGGSP